MMFPSELEGLRIGYVPYAPDFSAPADRRRFAGYAANRGLDIDLAHPGGTYDLVVLSARADITAWRRTARGEPVIIFDLIDSYLAEQATSIRATGRGTAKFLLQQHRYLEPNYKSSLRRLCRRSEVVTCTTREQSESIGRYCPQVHEILDLHDGEIHRAKTSYEQTGPIKILWEGLPQNAWTLGLIKEALTHLQRERGVELIIVTDTHFERWLGRVGRTETASVLKKCLPGIPFRVEPWTTTNLHAAAAEADLAVIPIPEANPIYQGKPENKLLILWRLGLPVIATATPAYARAMTEAEIDGACATSEDWTSRLQSLAEDSRARIANAERGHAHVCTKHARQVTLAQWDTALLAALDADRISP